MSRPFSLRKIFYCLAAPPLVLEIALRIAGFGDPLLYVTDPACRYLPASSQSVHRMLSFTQINADGMRSPPVVSPKPPDEFRALFLGDSVLFAGTWIDQSKVVTNRLNQDLPEQLHRPVEILNASTGGWAIDNEVGYLRTRGTFNADLVVFFLNSGDATQPVSETIPGVSPSYPDRRPWTAIGEVWSRYASPPGCSRPRMSILAQSRRQPRQTIRPSLCG